MGHRPAMITIYFHSYDNLDNPLVNIYIHSLYDNPDVLGDYTPEEEKQVRLQHSDLLG